MACQTFVIDFIINLNKLFNLFFRLLRNSEQILREDPEGMDLEAKKRPAKAASFAPVKGDDTKGKLSDMLVARVSLDFK